ncbi:allophanate hydrolase [Arthrobacter sp. CAN_A214]|uniref:allophanate hydrolase n=1 Tax=Arthrobacter sp. CAN_A214 TaxID=2787720 RepID=UPI0018C996DC
MTFQLPPLTVDPVERIKQAYRNIENADRPEVWIYLRPESAVIAEAQQLRETFQRRSTPPLFGVLVAIKDNIDVAGLPTTAGCPSYSYVPRSSAPAVQLLLDAGAIVVGKTNLDQFATGLVGTRSPYGAVRNAYEPELVSGGSSSGSAVAVALGLVDAALGTDTAGSGRIPAAFNRIYSIKATVGYVPLAGVVSACASYDCVNVFARTLSLAGDITAVMGAPEPGNSRALPATYPLAARPDPVIAVASLDQMPQLQPSWRDAYSTAVARAEALGWTTRTVDIADLIDVGALLYSGALVAERHAAVGAFVEGGSPDLDPTVAEIIVNAGKHSASALASDQAKVREYTTRAEDLLTGVDALLLPTAPFHPSIAVVEADPMATNSQLGVFTTFLNVLDMAAVAFPSPDEKSFGLSLIGRAFEDEVLLDLTSRFTGQAPPSMSMYPSYGIGVFGAHMRGEPLNEQLLGLGAAYAGDIRTAPAYRLLALSSDDAVTKVALTPSRDGRAVDGELWRLSPAGLGELLEAVKRPQSLGKILTEQGDEVSAFLCDSTVSATATDISEFGGWRAFASSRLVHN